MQRTSAGRAIAPELDAHEIEDLLFAPLGGAAFRLYLEEGDDAFVCVHRTDSALDEPWEIALTTPRLWMKAIDRLLPLADVSESLGLTPPEVSSEIHRVAGGGLLLHRTGGTPKRIDLDDLAPRLRGALAVARSRRKLRRLDTFRSAVDAALPYGFLGIDGLGRVQFLGGKAESILGVSEAEAIGRDCVSVFRPVGLEKHPLLEGLRRAPRSLELYLAQPKGGEIPVSLQLWRARPGDESRAGGVGKSARASDDSEAHALRLVAFFTDLSEERSLGEAERQKDRLAVLGELSAGIAHEIRNPLTGIANCAQVLRESLDPDHSGQRFLTIVSDEVARLNRIVEGLLGYARPNRPELREGDIEATIRRALELSHSELDAAGIRSELRVRSRIPAIYFDAHQIEQVLLNLIQNARDAMPGGGELRIETGLVKRLPHRRRGAGRRASDRVRLVEDPPRARFVQIKLTDTGSGISDEILARIWNPFFTTRPRGTGLGLPLSQSIVREHGGFLTLRSVVSKGTTALLDLPVERRQGERRRNAD